jgi:hypothetical protein
VSIPTSWSLNREGQGITGEFTVDVIIERGDDRRTHRA